MARIEVAVTVVGSFSYEAPAYGAPWKMETHYIHKMKSDDGRVFVWKTTSSLGKWVKVPGLKCANFIDKNGCPEVWSKAYKGDILRIKATEGTTGTYKGEIETSVSRVTVLEWIFKTETPEEKAARIAAEKATAKEALLASVKDGDEIITMLYSRFKKHYADCETVPDSYRKVPSGDGFRNEDFVIDVIVRAGRMKNSGTRGKSFLGYNMAFDLNGEKKTKLYWAVSLENAEKRVLKEFPGAENVECFMKTHNSPKFID